MLHTGGVPSLFPTDELDQILNSLQPIARSAGLPETRDALRAFFISRVRDHLHLVLAFSPVGDAFRVRCRMFPSLINCTTVDWYDPWPEDALKAVAHQVFEAAASLEEGGMQEDERTRAKLCALASYVHASVREMASRFYDEQRRRSYVTPKSYLELLGLYTAMLAVRRKAVSDDLARLEGGVTKLTEANASVAGMRIELSELQPVLEVKRSETSKLLLQVQAETEKANQQKAQVEKEAHAVGVKSAEVQVMAEDAQADLDKALPAFHSAIASLKSLSKNDLVEVKTYTKPPALVQKVMEAVCTLLNTKTDWDTAKKLLGDPYLMDKLINFDKDHIPPRIMQKLNYFYDEPDFVPEVVEKVSAACRSLCLWCRAMKIYNTVSQVIEPKRKALADAQATLDTEKAKLAEIEAQLAAVVAKVDQLQGECDATLAEKTRLQDAADQTNRRLITADKLTSGLADESVRWSETAVGLRGQLGELTGSVFVCSAFVAYAGPFTAEYRRLLLDDWSSECAAHGLRATPRKGGGASAGQAGGADGGAAAGGGGGGAASLDEGAFNLVATMGEPVLVRQWQQWGLPIDDYSTENGILATVGKRWPLSIDPQGQANKWIRAMEGANRQLSVMRPTEKHLLRTLEAAVRSGAAVLLEDIGETLDASLESVLTQAVYTQQGRTVLKVGDTPVDFNPAFRMYITTKLANPHYLPEVCIKVTLINFTVTLSGLEDQLLGLVVREEKPQLEKEKDELIVSMANDKKTLSDLEAEILRLLSASEGNILDDSVLVETLSSSKATAAVIGHRVLAAEATQRSLTAARASYLPAATRGSLLYFAIADLAKLDPMYQFSLGYFSSLFLLAVQQAQPAAELEVRLDNIMVHATLVVFENVARGLFEVHKATFAFLVASTILRAAKAVSDVEWLALLLGNAGVGARPTNPPPAELQLESAQWSLACYLQEQLDFFAGLTAHLAAKPDEWLAWQRAAAPWLVPMPGQWGGEVSDLPPFAPLLMTKVLRPELLLGAMQHVVATTLGRRFAERPPLQLGAAFGDATPYTPLIFVLTSGADPLGALVKFAAERGFAERMKSTSLGQGQGPVAEALVKAGALNGDWVLLQNCHLATSWMPQLERLVEELALEPNLSDDFRLWLTSFPNLHFPIPVLQNAVKMTYEPPKGLRANMQSTWRAMDGTSFDRCSACTPTWRRLLFGLTTLHALLQERRKFGAIGFNIRYDFNETDLEISIETLAMLLEQQPDAVPWDALRYVTGHIHYGGRVTDDWDRRCVLSLLDSFYCEAALESGYGFAEGARDEERPSTADADGGDDDGGGEADEQATLAPAAARADDADVGTLAARYVAPPPAELASYRRYVEALPLDDDVALFGLHQNAKITCGLAEAASVLRTIVDIQPRLSSGGAAASAESTAASLAQRLAAELPSQLLRGEALNGSLGKLSSEGKVDVGALTSLQLVLLHELDRFNHLLLTVETTLRSLQLAIAGSLLMSDDLEKMLDSMMRGEVPAAWAKAAYPSLKPLASWFTDLQYRVDFVRRWLVGYRPPERFMLPYFFLPQGFLTGVLQMHARKHRTPIDFLSFSFTLLDEPTAEVLAAAAAEGDGATFTPMVPPEDGVLVEGLYLAGARYNRTLRMLQPPRPKQMVDPLPAVHFEPTEHRMRDEADYECPLYKTSARAGVLSTTGASTNFVIALSMPSREPPKRWVRMGVAALCSTDD